MLIQFNFSNFKSFKEENTLDMTASSIKEHSHNLIERGTSDKYLKVAAVYGANASGKSNMITAFDFMQYFVVASLRIEGLDKVDKSIPIKNFIFDELSKNNKSEFEVFFIKNNIEYQYGFSLDKEKVYEEWLFTKTAKAKKFKPLFVRVKEKIKCEKGFSDADKFKDSVEGKTLFLTLVAKTKVKKAKEVYDWFLNCNVVDFGNSFFESFLARQIPAKRIENSTYKEKLEGFLAAIDTGIKGIRIEKSETEDNTKYKVYSKHSVKGTSQFTEIPLSEESSGTQKMFCLFEYFTDCLENGSVLFIDELDAKLHPLLLRYIINIFHDPMINKNNAQLIYTTHDVFNLTRDLFRRDQIWFVEKDINGVSSLFSLVEYKLDDNTKVRNDATYSKDYISGRYGAVPLLKEFNIMEVD